MQLADGQHQQHDGFEQPASMSYNEESNSLTSEQLAAAYAASQAGFDPQAAFGSSTLGHHQIHPGESQVARARSTLGSQPAASSPNIDWSGDILLFKHRGIGLQVTLGRTSCLQKLSRQLEVLPWSKRSMQHCMHRISLFSTGMRTTRQNRSNIQRSSITLTTTRLYCLWKGRHPNL